MRIITAAAMREPVFFGILGAFWGEPAGISGWIVGTGACDAGDGECDDGGENGSCAGGGGGGVGDTGMAGAPGCFTGAPQYSQKFLSCPTSFPQEVQNGINVSTVVQNYKDSFSSGIMDK